MDRSMPGKRIAHLGAVDPIAYVRGLQQLIPLQRLDYLLARTGRVQKRKGRLLAFLNHVAGHRHVLIRHPFHSHGLVAFTSVSDDAQTRTSPPSPKHADGWASRRCVSSLKKLPAHGCLAPVGTPGVFYRSHYV